ncbi:MAG TPA: polysaccharide biosynthesis/export family protein [Nitrospiria bacterium]|nr:polysaccharide biosynthesis/export family protein [Nitrospiria bacterium]
MKGFETAWAIVASAALCLLPVPVGAITDGTPTDLGYRLGPEDVLQISVWKDDSLTREVLVRPDGMISFPLIGEVQAEGRTAEELRKDIRQRLSPFIPEPTVSVAVTKVNSYKIYVIGKVNRPGEYLVGHYSNVMQALSLAGGMTPYASENGIKVLRWEQGNQRTYPFRYGDVKKGNHLEQNILLQRGDVIVVP